MEKAKKYIKKFTGLNKYMKKSGLSDTEIISIIGFSALDAIQKTNNPDKFHDDFIKMIQALKINN